MFKPVLFALAMSLMVDVCGYKKAGKGKSLPASIKTIAVPVFQNSSLKYRVEQRFTQAVIDEILKRARAIRVVTSPDNADAVLNGHIFEAAYTPDYVELLGVSNTEFNIALIGQQTAEEACEKVQSSWEEIGHRSGWLA